MFHIVSKSSKPGFCYCSYSSFSYTTSVTAICVYIQEHTAPGDSIQSQEMPGTEVPLGWVAIF